MPTPPLAILDNLEHLPDPFRLSPQEVAPQLSKREQQLDYYYALRYLVSYKGSSATFNAYRREVERILQWLWQIHGGSLQDIRREHIEQFMDFCISPPNNWIGIKNVARFKTRQGMRLANNEWRPFVCKYDKATGMQAAISAYRPSQKAIQSSFAILSSFFNFLIQEEFISANPVALVRQKSRFIQFLFHYWVSLLGIFIPTINFLIVWLCGKLSVHPYPSAGPI